MGLITEVRKRSGSVVAPAIGVLALVYVVHHAVDGERGIRGWNELNNQIAELQREAAEVEQERDVWARRVRLVHPQSFDADIFDEYARRVLNLARPNEVVILLEPEAGASR